MKIRWVAALAVLCWVGVLAVNATAGEPHEELERHAVPERRMELLRRHARAMEEMGDRETAERIRRDMLRELHRGERKTDRDREWKEHPWNGREPEEWSRLQERVRELRHAAEILRQEDMPDAAEELLARAERMERELREMHARRERDMRGGTFVPERGRGLDGEIEALARQQEELRERMRDVHAALERRLNATGEEVERLRATVENLRREVRELRGAGEDRER